MNLSESYSILGVNTESSSEEIKKAYRKRIFETHPDRGGDAKEFIRVQAAYEIICEFHNTNIEQEIPIPDELKKVISEIVAEFRKHYENIEKQCDEALSELKEVLIKNINDSKRGELRTFNEYFILIWDRALNRLFRKFNKQCNLLITKYEQWFNGTIESMDSVFHEKYISQLKSFRSNNKFYILSGFIFIAVSGIIYLISTTNDSNNWINLIAISLGITTLLIPVIWWGYCYSKKPKHETIKQIRVLDITPFKINPESDFQGSHELKKGQEKTIISGFAGASILSMVSGATIEGAVLGIVAGEIYDRIKNPTQKIKNELIEEVNKLLEVARDDIIKYSLETQKSLLDGITKKIIDNYEARIKKAIRLITE
jgi:hypothetical protein